MSKGTRIFILIRILLAGSLQQLCAQYDKDVFFMRGRQALADGR